MLTIANSLGFEAINGFTSSSLDQKLQNALVVNNIKISLISEIESLKKIVTIFPRFIYNKNYAQLLVNSVIISNIHNNENQFEIIQYNLIRPKDEFQIFSIISTQFKDISIITIFNELNQMLLLDKFILNSNSIYNYILKFDASKKKTIKGSNSKKRYANKVNIP